MTLSERLMDLAGVMTDSGHGEKFDRECLALAAARMAQDEMLALADDLVADALQQLSLRNEYQDSEEITRLHIAIRALRDGLD